MKRRVKVDGIVIFVAVFLIAFLPNFFLRQLNSGLWDIALAVLGMSLILLGQILRISARGYKSEYSKNGFSLVKAGPYTLVRNPMYLGILLIGLGISLVLFQWWVMVIFLFIFVTRYLWRIFKEEKKLWYKFTQDYQAYQKNVPCILPSITMLLRKDIAEYLPIKLSWLKKEVGSTLAVLLITIYWNGREEIKLNGLQLYLPEAIAMLITVILFVYIIIYLGKRTRKFEQDLSSKSKTAL